MPEPIPFTAEQQTAHDELKRLVADPHEADAIYDELPGSGGGRVISTDLARFLDKRYAAVPPGQPRDIAPGWDLAWRYAQNRFERELLLRRDRKTVQFMAGGWAAGKTHALERNSQIPDLTWDGTLQDSSWAKEMIDLALEEGWIVEIAYVFRDLELALYGALERASAEGRTVPLDQLPKVHRNVQISILSLFDSYFDNESVSFILLHNVGTAAIKIPPLQIWIADLEPKGALHYTQAHESYFAKAAAHVTDASLG